jgi:hypothetical protein
VEYLRCYLADLEARSIIEEPNYFDRDYLSEFTTFYASSAHGYPNTCRRLNVFSLELPLLRARFNAAISGDVDALPELSERYVGFLIIRPVAPTPIGRTVLRWYPETKPGTPRVTAPSRDYRAHVCGIPLSVRGLAWQQQDTAVGACATVALWSMLHSSALDEKYAIPTTAEITRRANERWPLGHRVFPATDGLTIHQICEAIRGQGLQAGVLEGDVEFVDNGRRLRAFSPTRYAASCAAFLRSGYPLLTTARMIEGNDITDVGHAVCTVGLRPLPSPNVPAGEAYEEDREVACLYMHNDNLGPSVRVVVEAKQVAGGAQIAVVRCDAPPPLHRPATLPEPTQMYGKLMPTTLVAALPGEIRMTSDYLYARAVELAASVSKFLDAGAKAAGISIPGVTFSARFFRLRDYLSAELGQRLAGRKLAKARLALVGHVPPMSLHLGVVRVGIAGTPIFDVLFDTTDSEPATQAFAHVLFQQFPLATSGPEVGLCVRAF